MVNVLHIKNSKSKAYKHKKQGRIGKNCKYYNDEKCTCILSYKSFCKSDNCNCYKEKEHKIIKSDDDIVPLPMQAGTHERTNEYIKISKNIGTPCHVGYMKSTEPRRHKARCIYYEKESKKCTYYLYKCVGSSRCEKYHEKELNK